MTVRQKTDGLYEVQGHNNRKEFPTMRRAIRFIRYMGETPVFALS